MTIIVKNMSMKELVSEYNAAARYLGDPEVNRFSDRVAAERRCLALTAKAEQARLDRAAIKNGTDSFETKRESDPALIAQLDAAIDAHPSPTPAYVKKSITERNALESPEKPQEAKATPQPHKTTSVTERWRVAKREEPSKRAYRPKPNTSQALMYKLLTREGGIVIEEFCAEMTAAGIGDKSWAAPAGVWSGLRYLFVAQKGYGLSFDGQRLTLLRPADEQGAEIV